MTRHRLTKKRTASLAENLLGVLEAKAALVDAEQHAPAAFTMIVHRTEALDAAAAELAEQLSALFSVEEEAP